MKFDFFSMKPLTTSAKEGTTRKIIDQEVQWDKTQTIISRTDKFGTINFANDVFCRVCGYSEAELLGAPHSIIRHPDMPKIIFKVLWDNILDGNNFHAIVKNLAKDGRYYWVITNFTITRDANGEIISFLARRNSVPSDVVNQHIAPLYKKLLEIEKVGGMEASGAFVTQHLQSIGKSYPQFIYDIMESSGANVDFLSKSTLGENPFLR